jgi:hypothetical protein
MRIFIALALLIAAPAFATGNDLRSVAGMEEHNRVLLVFTPSLADPRTTEQRRIFAASALDVSVRDIVLVQVGGGRVLGAYDKAAKLQRHFAVPANVWRALLIDKDAHVVHVSDRPIARATMVQTIDAGLIRQAELRRIRAGKGL